MRDLTARDAVAMFDMTGYAELKRLLTKVEVIEEKLMANELEMLRSLKAKYVEPLNPDPFDVTSLNVMLRNVEIRTGTVSTQGGMEAGSSIFPAEESRIKTRQPPLACRLPALRPCHLAPPDYMVTDAAIMGVARA